MERYDIFKSEGGFRVCGGTWAGGPVIDSSPWYATLEEAEKGRDAMKARHFEEEAFECAFSDIPLSFYSPEVRARAEAIKREVDAELWRRENE